MTQKWNSIDNLKFLLFKTLFSFGFPPYLDDYGSASQNQLDHPDIECLRSTERIELLLMCGVEPFIKGLFIVIKRAVYTLRFIKLSPVSQWLKRVQAAVHVQSLL